LPCFPDYFEDIWLGAADVLISPVGQTADPAAFSGARNFAFCRGESSKTKDA